MLWHGYLAMIIMVYCALIDFSKQLISSFEHLSFFSLSDTVKQLNLPSGQRAFTVEVYSLLQLHV